MAGKQAESAQRLILDSGAVIALARAEPRAIAFLRRALELDAEVVVPVVVVAETVRGGPRDAAANRVLNAIGDVEATRAEVGRVAGRLLGRSHSTATMNAMVAAEAVVRGGGRILTGDPADLTRLVGGERGVTVHPLAQPATRRRRGTRQ